MDIVNGFEFGVQYFTEILAREKNLPKLLLVAGCSCSGKSTFARRLANNLEQIGIGSNLIEQDMFFKDKRDCPVSSGGDFYILDSPDSFYLKSFNDSILNLLAGKSIPCPIYDVTVNQRIGSEEIHPQKIIIGEGLYPILSFGRKFPNTISVYLDSPPETRIKRRVERNIEKFKTTEEEIIAFWKKRVVPYEWQIEEQKYLADFVVKN